MSEATASRLGVLQLGDPLLRRTCPAATADIPPEDIDRICAILKEFRQEIGFGRAVAAAQLGMPHRMIAISMPGWPRVIVNPIVVWHSQETITMWDDCMSFPSLLVKVRRWASITVEFSDEHGKTFVKEQLSVAESELLQHEIDHLDGILAVDRAIDRDSIVSRVAFAANEQLFQSQVTFGY